MTIFWLGETNNYEQMIERRPLKECNLMLACNDYAVLQIAMEGGIISERPKHYFYIPFYAAKACTSRLAQRVALAGTGLNPAWQPLILKSNLQVIKQAGSTANTGVRFFPENNQLSGNEQMDVLCDLLPELANYGVAEYQVEGIHYEIDGCIIDKQIMFFSLLEQEWSKYHEKITAYKIASISPAATNELNNYNIKAYNEIHRVARKAINTIGLNNSCFCIEIIHSKIGTLREDWFVIEVNARLGDDKGLAEVMCKSGNPIKEVEEFAREVLGK